MTRRQPIVDVHPTQLFLSREKLAGVLEWFDVDEPTYEPLRPSNTRERGISRTVTRAFAAALAGVETLRTERDDRVRGWIDRCQRAAEHPEG